MSWKIDPQHTLIEFTTKHMLITTKDATREVVFDVIDQGQMKDPWGNQRRGLSATAELNRKDFGLNWNVALEAGGWLVGDKIRISVDHLCGQGSARLSGGCPGGSVHPIPTGWRYDHKRNDSPGYLGRDGYPGG